MKKKMKFISALLAVALVLAVLFATLTACGVTGAQTDRSGNGYGAETTVTDETQESSDKDDDYTYEEDLETSLVITCVEGTADAYTLVENGDGTSTLTFTAIDSDTVYSLSGTLNGNVVIDVDETETYKFELELQGVTIQSANTSPIIALSGDKVTISAKKDTQNYVYDNREAVDEEDENQYSSAVYSVVDLSLQGKGYLWIYSENNNGVHTKDDLTVKNLTLYVKCVDNALKGNDSVTVEGTADLTLIATAGDGVKTSNNEVSSKGNQKGIVTLSGGTINIYAACDGIDAAYDVVIDSQDVTLNIYTDKYSSYSEEVTYVSDGYYIRATTTAYTYSILYTNPTTGATKWVSSSGYTAVTSSSGRGPWGGGNSGTTYYYYSVEKPSGYTQMQIYVYTSGQTQGQSDAYYATVNATVNDSYDTIAYTGSSFGWTNYTTSTNNGRGGMDQGNTDKGDYSTKGIKAANDILVSAGTIFIKSYDDAIHSDGSVEISGGNNTLYSNDDGIHAEDTLTITGGNITVNNSYEGLEGGVIVIDGGFTTVRSKDDGVNATNTTGTDLYVKSGYLYVYAGGDGLDTNSTTSYAGISFEGGTTVVISTSGGNSCIDSERGYKYTGGKVLAMCPTGMTSECEMCANFSSVAVKKTGSLTSGTYVTVGSEVAVKVPTNISNAYIVYLSGSNGKTISTSSGVSFDLDTNNVYWAE